MKIKETGKFNAHVIFQYPMESVGLVIRNKIKVFKNIHTDPVNNFKIDPKIYPKLKDSIQGIVHSHTYESFTEDPRTPTKEDMILAENTGLPCGIVHTDGKQVSPILWFNNPKYCENLLGRSYIKNVTDCFTLFTDYYFKNFQIKLPLLPRQPDWSSENPNLMSEILSTSQFYSVEKPEIGDLLMFSIGTNYLNHVGVYTGKGNFIHHLYERVSSEDKLTKWKRQLRSIYRYKHG